MLTVIVLTYNEADRLQSCLESVQWADGLLVVDGYSTDDTVAMAERLGARVVLSDRLGPAKPGGFSDQRNFALEQVQADWVFFLDADERFTPELGAEIQRVLACGVGEDIAAFRVRRIEHFWGVRTDYTHAQAWQTRLLRRSLCKYDGRLVHEGPVCEGRIESLDGQLLHYSKDSVAQYVTTMNRYTTLEAEQAITEKRVLPRSPLKGMVKTFANSYFYKRSYREGAFGLAMSLLFAFYSGLSWIKHWELLMKAGCVSPSEPRNRLRDRIVAGLAWFWRLLRPPAKDMDTP